MLNFDLPVWRNSNHRTSSGAPNSSNSNNNNRDMWCPIRTKTLGATGNRQTTMRRDGTKTSTGSGSTSSTGTRTRTASGTMRTATTTRPTDGSRWGLFTDKAQGGTFAVAWPLFSLSLSLLSCFRPGHSHPPSIVVCGLNSNSGENILLYCTKAYFTSSGNLSVGPDDRRVVPG